MTRLIAYVANRTDRLLSALNEEQAAIGETPAPDADAWGIGFYQSGDVLLKKRPYRNGDPVSWADIANNVPTDSAIIHLRAATIGNYRAENTHPFRMRQWLFAHTGTVNAFDTIRAGLLAAIPDFLQRSIRGATDSEVLFHVFLAFLHDRDALDAPDLDQKTLASCIRSTVSLVDNLTSEIGAPDSMINLALSNGRTMAVLSRGTPTHFTQRTILSETRGQSASFRYVMAVARDEAPPAYETIPRGRILFVERDLSTHIAALDA